MYPKNLQKRNLYGRYNTRDKKYNRLHSAIAEGTLLSANINEVPTCYCNNPEIICQYS